MLGLELLDNYDTRVSAVIAGTQPVDVFLGARSWNVISFQTI